jgi:hypothetical protein
MNWYVVYLITNRDGSQRFEVQAVWAENRLAARDAAQRLAHRRRQSLRAATVEAVKVKREFDDCVQCGWPLGTTLPVAIGPAPGDPIVPPLLIHQLCLVRLALGIVPASQAVTR